MAFSEVKSRQAIWFLSFGVIAGGILSYSRISPWAHPMVDTVTQCPWPVFSIWTNSSVHTENARVDPKITSCNPLMWGYCLLIRCWLASMRLSFNQSPPNKISFSLSVNWSTQCTDLEVLSVCTAIWSRSTGLPQILLLFFCRRRKATRFARWLEQWEDFRMEDWATCWLKKGAAGKLEQELPAGSDGAVLVWRNGSLLFEVAGCFKKWCLDV